MQMLFGAMLVNALHAALEDRIVAFNRIRGDFAPNVFVALVVHRFMAGEVLAHLIVPATFVGIDRGFMVHIGADDCGNLGYRMRVDLEAASCATALNKREHDVPEGNAGLLAALGSERILADESFVGFYSLASAAHGRHQAALPHGFADAMGKEPCRLVCDAQGAVKLMRANALLGRRQQKERLKPHVQFDMAAFHDAFGRDGKVFPATLGLAAIDAGLFGNE